jgi:[ribosomal protein S5]-alanine N-acetyltransferase
MNAKTGPNGFRRFAEAPRQKIAELTHCRLRSWQLDDIPLVHQHLNDPLMWRFLSADFPGTVSLEFAEHYLASYSANNQAVFFAAAALDSDEAIGGVFAELGTDIHARSAEYGGWLARSHWRSGIARDVTVAFTDWLFETRGILRVHAAPFHLNRASIGTLQAAGFTFEGRLRCSVVKNGRIMDQLQYAKINPACPGSEPDDRRRRAL